MNEKLFTVACICGSMRFYADMLDLAERLTKLEYVVLMPFATKTELEQREAP